MKDTSAVDSYIEKLPPFPFRNSNGREVLNLFKFKPGDKIYCFLYKAKGTVERGQFVSLSGGVVVEEYRCIFRLEEDEDFWDVWVGVDFLELSS